MSKQLLYLFGEPGTGKITVARVLQQRLGWRLFWLHDLDTVCAIVGRYPIPRLMDRISLAVLEELMDAGEDVIYVRPSRDKETVQRVLNLAWNKGCSTHAFRLWAAPSTLAERVSRRERSAFRVGNAAELERYLFARPVTSRYLGEVPVCTEGRTPEQVADLIQHMLKKETDGGTNDNG